MTQSVSVEMGPAVTHAWIEVSLLARRGENYSLLHSVKSPSS